MTSTQRANPVGRLDPECIGAVAEYSMTWDSRDALLYAVAIGAGSEDPSGRDLVWTAENVRGRTQRVLPTFAVIVGREVPGLRQQIEGLDPTRVVHAYEVIDWQSELPISGCVRVTSLVSNLFDKGSGAILEVTTTVHDLGDRLLATRRSGVFVVGAGGWGGDRGPSWMPVPCNRDADLTVNFRTSLNQALLYRLTGDRNPLHVDPAVSSAMGFDRPILHGLCTFGFAGRAMVDELGQGDPGQLRSMAGQFRGTVVPGDELRVEIFIESPTSAAFRVVNHAGVVAIDNGHCELQSPMA